MTRTNYHLMAGSKPIQRSGADQGTMRIDPIGTYLPAVCTRNDDPGSEVDLLVVRIYNDIAEVCPAEWDGFLDPDDLQSTHRFIKTCQDAAIADSMFRHISISDIHGPACVATLCCMPIYLDLLSYGGLRRSLRPLRKNWSNLLRIPILFCGLPVSFGNACIRFRPGVATEPILKKLAGVMDEQRRAIGAAFLCFKEFRCGEIQELDPLLRLGYFRAPSLPGCVLPIQWETFDAYIAALRSGYRRQIRTSLRVRETASLELRIVEDFGKHCESIFALYEQVMDRAEFQLERLNLEFFKHLNANLGEQVRALLVEHRGELLAAGILLYSPRVLTFLLAGIDYARNRQYHAYLNLVTEVVAEAIRAKVERVELGQTSYYLKQRLGGCMTPRYLYLRHRNACVHHLVRTLSGVIFPDRIFAEKRTFRESQ